MHAKEAHILRTTVPFGAKVAHVLIGGDHDDAIG
jgi:hypothetical protein